MAILTMIVTQLAMPRQLGTRRWRARSLPWILLVSCHLGAQASSLQPMAVETADHATVNIDLVRPDGRPKALVIVSPGTGGLPDPYFDAELAKPRYDVAHKGGMAQALTRAGFAAAFIGQRGYAPLGDCLAGSPQAKRAEVFVLRCIDQRVRGTVDLDSNAEDMRAAIARVSGEPDLKALPLVVVAFSESFRHIAWLVEAGRARPDVIVAIGGPTEPWSSLIAYQLRKDWALGLAQAGLARCAERELPIDKVFACAGWPARTDLKGRVADALGGNVASSRLVQERREWWRRKFAASIVALGRAPPDATIGGAFQGIPIPVAWSANFYRQGLADKRSAPQRLARWPGSLLLTFGRLDSLVLVPTDADIEQLKRSRGGPTEVVRWPGLGHGLDTEAGETTPEVLETLVSRIDELLERRPTTTAAGRPASGPR